MSEEDEARPIVTNAREIDACAADWLQRRHFWGWSDNDEKALDTWLAESLVHRVAYVRLQTGWRRTERLAVLHSSTHFKKALFRRDRIVPILLSGVAATVIVAMLAFMGRGQVSHPRMQVYTAAVGGRELISLTDGSQIELNTDTTLRTKLGSGTRTVWLEKGEAYFRIKHDSANPFVVIAGDRRITDLGTKFSVRRDGNNLEVTVLEGRVQLDAHDSHSQLQSTLLTSGEVAIATADTISIVNKPEHELAEQLSWRRDMVAFNHTTLAAAAAEFNRYNARKLVITDPATADLTIGGTFRTNDLDSFVGVTQRVLGLRVENRGEEILISR